MQEPLVGRGEKPLQRVSLGRPCPRSQRESGTRSGGEASSPFSLHLDWDPQGKTKSTGPSLKRRTKGNVSPEENQTRQGSLRLAHHTPELHPDGSRPRGAPGQAPGGTWAVHGPARGHRRHCWPAQPPLGPPHCRGFLTLGPIRNRLLPGGLLGSPPR